MVIPNQAIIANAKIADKRYKLFDLFCDQSTPFANRLKDNAIIKVVKEF